MDKKTIIVAEIEKWRSSKLLPEHYCDFLLNLYLDEQTAASHASSSSLFAGFQKHWRSSMWVGIFLIIFTTIGIIGFYFNAFSLPLQIGLVLMGVVILYGLGFWLRKKQLIASFLAFGTGSALLLTAGVYLIRSLDAGEGWLVGYVAICSAIWVAIGWLARLPVFQLSGWLGLLLFYGYLGNQMSVQPGVLVQQLMWLPLSLLFLWLSWLVHNRKRTSARIYFTLGLIIWFAPEVYAFAINGAQGLVLGFHAPMMAETADIDRSRTASVRDPAPVRGEWAGRSRRGRITHRAHAETRLRPPPPMWHNSSLCHGAALP